MGSIEIGTVYTGSDEGRIKRKDGGSRQLAPNQAVVKVTHCGICYSDVHFTGQEDFVLGHEPVGVVVAMGSAVRSLKKGDKVGYGCIRGSCERCTDCVSGNDQVCRYKKAFGTHDRDQGGFGDTVCIDENFLHKIPDSMPMEHAAVFQCAGATVLGGLLNAGVKPFDRVGVCSVGGLGHLAIQFARSMGCEVVAFSGTMSKKDEALRLGAHEFVSSKENPKFKGVKPVNHMIICSSAQPDWKSLVRVVTPRGTLVPLSVDGGSLDAPYAHILMKELRIIGSMVCGRGVHEQMLDFAARHKITPMIETMNLTESNINTAFDRLKKGDVRYRFVMINEKNQHLLDGSKL